MPAVVISRSLRLVLGDPDATELAQDFRDYKAGLISFGAIFGRDKAFGWPAAVREHQLWHVHLEDEQASPAWDSLTENFHKKGFTQDNYTSNTMLVYARVWDAYKAPFLLHSILSPDGHQQMSDAERMLAIAAEFAQERRDYSAQMPSSDWIIVE